MSSPEERREDVRRNAIADHWGYDDEDEEEE